ncbi:MAG: sodium:solute symporter, partial [Candidatus Hydrogenedentes bacterium]|nr:sodium:solute symporter [Candidatus Hydrogenedentota bacterium]
MQGRLIDIVVIAVYFGAIALAGLYFARKNTTTEAYFLGNRNFPAWAIGLSLVGTSI